MGRTLSTAMSNAISAKEGYADVWLLEISGSGGVIRYTTAPSDITWDSNTWTGIGGAIDFDPPAETSDPAGQSCRISLSGVDTSVIAEVLNNNVRGRDCKLYWGQITISSGSVVVDPLEAFAGMMNSGWTIEHTPSDPGTAGTVRVTTTIVSQLARHLFPRQVRTNVNSLLEMQARSSRDIYTPPGGEEADVFFQTIPAIVGQNVYWGRKGAAPIYTGKVVDKKEGPFY